MEINTDVITIKMENKHKDILEKNHFSHFYFAYMNQKAMEEKDFPSILTKEILQHLEQKIEER